MELIQTILTGLFALGLGGLGAYVLSQRSFQAKLSEAETRARDAETHSREVARDVEDRVRQAQADVEAAQRDVEGRVREAEARRKEVDLESESVLADARRKADEANLQAEQARRNTEQARRDAEQTAKEGQQAVREAELQAKDLIVQAKEQARAEEDRIREAEKGLEAKQAELDRNRHQIDSRLGDSKRREKDLDRRAETLESREKEVDELKAQCTEELERVAGLTAEEAERRIVNEVEEQAKLRSVHIQRKIEEEARETAELKAKKIIGQAIQRFAGEYVSERTVTVFKLPGDELKGRIIGREGRNIRAIEAATGVDLIVDDTPETVVISCHNPVRREVARRTLETLIADGRIHPTRIEDTVAKVSEEIDEGIVEAGENALTEIGVQNVHPEIVRTLGTLKYRTSYTQNVLTHSLEAAFICGQMAAELGLDPKMARRAALMHDIGKAVTHEVQGGHALIGGEIAEKYGEPKEVIHAIAAHHEDIPQEGILPVLVQASDAISGARPGARREMLSNYVERLENLERIADSFDGIEKSFAIQAGREVRVIVESDRVSDAGAELLARDLADKIESEMTFPGQIKVTVIRETRTTQYAK